MTVREALSSIKNDELAIKNSNSQFFINDRKKHIANLRRKIKKYCKSKNYNFVKFCKEYGI